MGRDNPAGIHFFSHWYELAQDESLALWLRLAALAYSSHWKNGHATFYLNGESTLPDVMRKSRRHLQNEIPKAVAKRFLLPESNVNCLVVPYGICGGAEGNAYGDCKLHPSLNL